jgi:hypothetical protein
VAMQSNTTTPEAHDSKWYQKFFLRHPLADKRDRSAFTHPLKPDKFKIYCVKCLEYDLAEAWKSDQQEVQAGTCQMERSMDKLILICRC